MVYNTVIQIWKGKQIAAIPTTNEGRAMANEIEVIGVKWDDEGDSGLPATVTIDGPDFVVDDSEELDEYISDELSNKYGFTHCGWQDHRWTV